MRRYQSNNARTEDLWNVLSEVSGEPVNLMMNTWTKSTGYPVIHVQLTDNILEFKQVLWSCNQTLMFTINDTFLSFTFEHNCYWRPSNVAFEFAVAIPFIWSSTRCALDCSDNILYWFI